MSGKREPSENIGGETGSSLAIGVSDDPDTQAEAVVDRLGTLYWRKTYGGQDPFVCLVRTVLTQNTSDVASQPAFETLLDRFGRESLAQALLNAERGEIAEAIASAGLYNQKARVLQEAAARVIDEFGDQAQFDRYVRNASSNVARKTLLEFNGVGPKTADCVLLFASGRDGVFPVDTHVHRIARRMGIAPWDADHEMVGTILANQVPPEKCGFGHTAMIQLGREYCTARHPACLDTECPLVDLCDQVGVDGKSDE